MLLSIIILSHEENDHQGNGFIERSQLRHELLKVVHLFQDFRFKNIAVFLDAENDIDDIHARRVYYSPWAAASFLPSASSSSANPMMSISLSTLQFKVRNSQMRKRL